MPGIVVVPPAEMPLSIDELKAQIRIIDEVTEEDALLAAYQRAAVGHIERGYDMPLITQTLDVDVIGFPALGKPLDLTLAPLQSVVSISYADSTGGSQTWGADAYRVIAPRSRIWPAVSGSYPTSLDAVTIRGVFGWGARNDVPEDIRQAIIVAVACWHADREGAMAALPPAAHNLLRFYKRNWIA